MNTPTSHTDKHPKQGQYHLWIQENISLEQVVGYIRVSTSRQAQEGGSLDEQAEVMRRFCKKRGFQLISIEEDDCSAAGSAGHKYRDGLKEALRKARVGKLPLVIPSADRLGRHSGVLKDIFDASIPVISIAEGRRLGKQSLEKLLNQAMAERDAIARRAREGMARSKARGTKMGNPTNLHEAQRRGAISNGVRADQKVKELADFIDTRADWEKLTLREKVELLNKTGPKNLISEQRRERRDWTTGSLRKPLKRAEELLDFNKALERDPDGDRAFVSGARASYHRAHTSGRNTRSREQIEMDEFYKDDPLYGSF